MVVAVAAAQPSLLRMIFQKVRYPFRHLQLENHLDAKDNNTVQEQ
jgi:hypothetical protein